LFEVRMQTSKLKIGRWRTVLLFLGPWLFSLIVLWYGPILFTFALSFMNYRLVGGGRFIGLENYIRIFADDMFWIGLRATFSFILLYLPINFTIGLLTAYLMNLNLRLAGLWRTLIYLPSILPAIAVLILGKYIFYPNGLLNSGLELIGIKGPFWLSDPAWIIPAAVMLMVWQCGSSMVVYLGALQGVPGSYYEAADMDGLSKPRQFISITLPLISPTIFFRVITDLIFGLMIFIPALILPEGNVPGGPANASRFYALHLYEKAFQRFVLGEASALAAVLIIISFALTFLIIRGSERFVHYEA
jgi:multiple sugar transport system permease protein